MGNPQPSLTPTCKPPPPFFFWGGGSCGGEEGSETVRHTTQVEDTVRTLGKLRPKPIKLPQCIGILHTRG